MAVTEIKDNAANEKPMKNWGKEGEFYLEKNNQGTREANSLGQNPLGVAPMGGLIAKFAIPGNAWLYNIVDQIFIGQGVGMLGNAATNVAFPVTTIATALALLLGIGGASNYNLEMGAGREKKASGIAG